MAQVQASGPAGVLQLIQSLTGGNTKTTTTTSGGGISAEGMDAMLRKILESNQGLAAVSSGQRASGMYDSTVNTQLLNDLMTRAAGEVAAQNKAPVTQTTATAGPSAKKNLAALAGMQLYGKVINPWMEKNNIWDSLTSFGNTGGTSFAADMIANPMSSFSPLTGGVSDALISNYMTPMFSDFTGSLLSDLGSSAFTDLGSSVGSDLVKDIMPSWAGGFI